MDARHVLAAVVVLSLGPACRHRPPVVVPPVEIIRVQRVDVPVAIRVAPPAELLAAPVGVPLPVFVAPTDPAASSALTAEGERRLRVLLNDLLTRIAAWKAWAAAGPAP